jgi:hypothetical protein
MAESSRQQTRPVRKTKNKKFQTNPNPRGPEKRPALIPALHPPTTHGALTWSCLAPLAATTTPETLD